MFLTGDSTFASFGYATMIVVAFAMLGSLTVLPALLSKLGDRVDRLHVPFVGRLHRQRGKPHLGTDRRPRAASTPSFRGDRGGTTAGARRPGPPAADGDPRPGHVPKSLDVVKTYNRMQQAFPGTALPANVVIKAPDVNVPAVPTQSNDSSWQHSPPAAHADPSRSTRDNHTIANVTVPILGKGTDAQSTPAWPSCASTSFPGPSARSRTSRPASPGSPPQWKDQRTAQFEAAARRRLRAHARVRADAGGVPLDRDRDQGDRAQLALGRRRLRRARARLPARHRQGPARLQLHRAGSTR